MVPGLRHDFLLVELGQGNITLVLSDERSQRVMIKVRTFQRGTPPTWIRCLSKLNEGRSLTLIELSDLRLGEKLSLSKITEFLNELNAKYHTDFGLGYFVRPEPGILEIKTTYCVMLTNSCPKPS